MEKFSKYKKLIFANIIFLAIIFFAVSSFYENSRGSKVFIPMISGEKISHENVESPDKLYIPALDVNTGIQEVGLTKSGNMGVPDNFNEVGWYKYGPEPGQVGKSVIAGHLDDAKGNAAVFYNLKDLTIGDDVFVESGEDRLHFKVREIRLVDYDNPPLEEIFGTSTEKASLNLITCDGTWNQALKTYEQRLVVFTDFIDSEPIANE